MKFEFDKINKNSTIHNPQDKISVSSFDFNKEKILIGVIADGCSGVYLSELGAQWMVDKFYYEAKKLYIKGLRGDELLRTITYNIVNSFPEYIPLDKNSMCNSKTNPSEYYSIELSATLSGFILDSKECAMVFAGDGFLIINGKAYNGEQNEGDMYPVYMMAWPKNKRKEKLDKLFTFATLDTSKIKSFSIASDGFGYYYYEDIDHIISNLSNNPHEFIKFMKNTEPGMAGAYKDLNSKYDDIAVVSVAIQERDNSRKLLDKKDIQPIINSISSKTEESFFPK